MPSTKRVKTVLKRELAKRNKYRTTYKDIKHYFEMINKAVFNNKLAPFNEIKIKKIYKDESSCLVLEKKRYGTILARNVTDL